MFIVKDGYIYVGVSLVLAAIVYYFFGAYWAVIPVVLALYFAYFFRDFHRSMPYDPNILYSPADGTVMGIEEIFDDEYLNEPALKLTIFLSVFNVHTNRAPLDGLLARRIVSWVTVGHELKQGETYGMIKFGSSTELIVPKNVEITVKKGDKVTGGITVVGRVKAE